MKYIFSVFMLCVFSFEPFYLAAQSNPTPFNLNTGNYAFTQWDNTNAAGTYPASMVFHFTENPTLGTYDHTAPGTADWNCAYNISARSRFFGKGANGIGIVATGGAQNNDCTGTSTDPRFVGAVVLALNTTGRTNIAVTWTGGLDVQADGGATLRQFVIRMQYRVGNSGAYTDVPGPIEFANAGKTAGDSETFSQLILPAVCEDEPEVQVRWIYFQETSGTGSRPEMRLDDIFVTSDGPSFPTILAQ